MKEFISAVCFVLWRVFLYSCDDDDEDNFISAISDSSLVFINNPTRPSSAAAAPGFD